MGLGGLCYKLVKEYKMPSGKRHFKYCMRPNGHNGGCLSIQQMRKRKELKDEVAGIRFG